MILTEEDAKTKRCQEGFGDRYQSSPINCIASGCMAWRWQYGELDEEAPRPGYCGKAGRPTP